MPGKSGGKGRGGGAGGRGREWGAGGPGRSASSPGHLKRAAGAQSARDYAPGRLGGQNDGLDVEDERDEATDEMRDDRQGVGGLLGRLFGRR